MPIAATLERVNTREYALRVIYDEFRRQGMTLDQLAALAGVAPNSIRAIRTMRTSSGSSRTLRGVEGALGLPRRLLDLIIDGDSERIAQLPTRPDDPEGMDPDLRRSVLDGLERDVDPPRGRRASDRHRRNRSSWEDGGNGM